MTKTSHTSKASEILLIAILSITSSWIYIRSGGEEWLSPYKINVDKIVAFWQSQPASPGSYRILTPFLISWIQLLTGESIAGFKWALFFFSCAGIFFSSLIIYLTIKKFTKNNAIINVLSFLIFQQMALMDHYSQPWSLLEAGFLLAAFYLSANKQPYYFLFIIILATLNRETAIIYSLTYLLFNHTNRKEIAAGIFGFIIPTSIYIYIRFFLIGNGPHVVSINDIFIENIMPRNFIQFFIPACLILLSVFIKTESNNAFGSISKQQKNGIIIVTALYALICLLFGIWIEIRIFLPLYPALLIIISKAENSDSCLTTQKAA